MGKQITAQDRKFLEGLFEGKEITRAAIDAGYPEETAGRIGREKIKDPVFRKAYIEELDKRGWDEEAIAKRIYGFMNATKKVYLGKDGVLIDVPNSNTVTEAEVKFIETTLRIKGFYDDEIDEPA